MAFNLGCKALQARKPPPVEELLIAIESTLIWIVAINLHPGFRVVAAALELMARSGDHRIGYTLCAHFAPGLKKMLFKSWIDFEVNVTVKHSFDRTGIAHSA